MRYCVHLTVFFITPLQEDEKAQIALVEKNPGAIAYIKALSEQVQLAAVSENPYVIGMILEPSETVQLRAVTYNADALKYIKHPTALTKLASQKEYRLLAAYIAPENK